MNAVRLLPLSLCSLLFFSCTTQKIRTSAVRHLLSDTVMRQAHVGISVYDPVKKARLYDHQSDKYFTPASNTKIITCYAALRHLGDSLEGIEWTDLDTAVLLFPTGDPTLLHPDFSRHRVAGFLRSVNKPIYISDAAWKTDALGSGWSWGDYSAYYMVERSALPVYGNVIRWNQSITKKAEPAHPGDSLDVFVYSDPEVDWPVDFSAPDPKGNFSVARDRDKNRFLITQGRERQAQREVPFVTDGLSAALRLLRDTIGREIRPIGTSDFTLFDRYRNLIRTQPLDSMLRPLMWRSDNFYAEQALLMTGRRLTGWLDESAAIGALLKGSLQGMPQPPRWADGSGLSRYNLFTPQDFVWVLDKLRTEFGMDRIRHLFPTAGQGTLRSYAPDLRERVHAKTGTLSGVVALSGYVVTKRQRLLIFSVLINNHQGTPAGIRKKLESFLRALVEKN